jgi:hypothetical protein
MKRCTRRKSIKSPTITFFYVIGWPVKKLVAAVAYLNGEVIVVARLGLIYFSTFFVSPFF